MECYIYIYINLWIYNYNCVDMYSIQLLCLLWLCSHVKIIYLPRILDSNIDVINKLIVYILYYYYYFDIIHPNILMLAVYISSIFNLNIIM